MKNWYEEADVKKWIAEEMSSVHLLEVDDVFHDKKKLESAIILLLKEEYIWFSDSYTKRAKQIQSSLMNSHEAALFMVYKTAEFRKLIASKSDKEKVKTPLLTQQQSALAEGKQSETIHFLEDFIYFLYDKSLLWWYKCPSFPFALNAFMQLKNQEFTEPS